MNRSFLTNHTTVQMILHPQQLFAVAFQHLRRRDTCPAFNNAGDLFSTHSFGHHRFGLSALSFKQRALKVWDNTIGQLTRFAQIAFALGNIQFGAGMIQLLFQITGPRHLVAFALPLRRHFRAAVLQISQVFYQDFQTIFGGCIVLKLQRLLLNLLLHDVAVQRIEFLWFAVNFHPQTAGCFVHQIDGFVRQEAIRNITVA